MRYFFLFLSCIISIWATFTISHATEGIISRADWGADETLRYADNPIWQTRNAAYLQYIQNPKTQSQLDAINAEESRVDFIQQYLGMSVEIVERKYSEN